MKKVTLIIIITLYLISCSNSKQNTPFSSPESDKEQKLNTEILDIQLSDFSEIDDSGIFMFPLKRLENKEVSYSSRHRWFSSDFTTDYTIWNIVFYNSFTNKYHLLSKDKILIKSLPSYDVSSSSDTIIKTNYIFYEVISSDFNQDNKIDEYNDPTHLYISDKQGNNFRQISPKDLNLLQWKYIPQQNKIILIATKDNNGNKEFEITDEHLTFEVDLNKDGKPKEIFMEHLKNEIKSLYNRDWKK